MRFRGPVCLRGLRLCRPNARPSARLRKFGRGKTICPTERSAWVGGGIAGAGAAGAGADGAGSVAPTPYPRSMARSPESPVAPRVSPPDLPRVFTPAAARRSVDLIAASLDLDGTVDLAHAALEQCTITADADSVDLTGATLIDVDLVGVRIASLKMRDASIRRLRISGGRIGTLDLSSSRIDELLLGDVRIDYLNLGAAKASDVEIRDCGIRTLDMPQAELTRVRFTGTRSDEVDSRGMRATHVDLRGLDAAAFLDANSLRGTTLTGFQVQQLAPLLAAGIGIQVTD